MLNSEGDSTDSMEYDRSSIVKSGKKKRKLVEYSDIKHDRAGVSNKTLDTFFEARKHLKTLQSKPNATKLTINPDEEMWIIHCPKNIETEDLLGRKLVLPQPLQIIESKKGNKEFECKLELTKQENHLTVICPTKEFPEAVSVKQAGMISIRERIKLPQPKESQNSDHNATNNLFSFPTVLKVRHPLLGVNFGKVVIKQEVHDTIVKSPKKKKSHENKGNDRIKIKQEPVEESPKKEKKRHKRPRDSFEIKVEPDEDFPPPKKLKYNKNARLVEDNDEIKSIPTKHKKIKVERES